MKDHSKIPTEWIQVKKEGTLLPNVDGLRDGTLEITPPKDSGVIMLIIQVAEDGKDIEIDSTGIRVNPKENLRVLAVKVKNSTMNNYANIKDIEVSLLSNGFDFLL